MPIFPCLKLSVVIADAELMADGGALQQMMNLHGINAAKEGAAADDGQAEAKVSLWTLIVIVIPIVLITRAAP